MVTLTKDQFIEAAKATYKKNPIGVESDSLFFWVNLIAYNTVVDKDIDVHNYNFVTAYLNGEDISSDGDALLGLHHVVCSTFPLEDIIEQMEIVYNKYN